MTRICDRPTAGRRPAQSQAGRRPRRSLCGRPRSHSRAAQTARGSPCPPVAMPVLASTLTLVSPSHSTRDRTHARTEHDEHRRNTSQAKAHTKCKHPESHTSDSHTDTHTPPLATHTLTRLHPGTRACASSTERSACASARSAPCRCACRSCPIDLVQLAREPPVARLFALRTYEKHGRPCSRRRVPRRLSSVFKRGGRRRRRPPAHCGCLGRTNRQRGRLRPLHHHSHPARCSRKDRFRRIVIFTRVAPARLGRRVSGRRARSRRGNRRRACV